MASALPKMQSRKFLLLTISHELTHAHQDWMALPDKFSLEVTSNASGRLHHHLLRTSVNTGMQALQRTPDVDMSRLGMLLFCFCLKAV